MDWTIWVVIFLVVYLVLYLIFLIVCYQRKIFIYAPYPYPPPEPTKCRNPTDQTTWGTSQCNATRVNGPLKAPASTPS